MPFKVAYPEVIRERLLQMARRVKPLGLSGELGRALDRLNQCLTDDPLGLGEIKYTTKHHRFPVCLLVRGFLSATYLVDEKTGRVIVLKLNMLSDHPFPRGIEKLLNDGPP